MKNDLIFNLQLFFISMWTQTFFQCFVCLPLQYSTHWVVICFEILNFCSIHLIYFKVLRFILSVLYFQKLHFNHHFFNLFIILDFSSFKILIISVKVGYLIVVFIFAGLTTLQFFIRCYCFITTFRYM